MISTSAEFLEIIRDSHELAVRATLHLPGGGTADLPIIDGSVTLDRTADHRGRASLTTVYDGTVTPYGSEIHLERGITHGTGSAELVSLGWYPVFTRDRARLQGQMTLDLLDRSRIVADSKLTKPRKFSAATLNTSAIDDLIDDVYPTVTITVPGTAIAPEVTGKLVVDEDRWQAVLDLSAAAGLETFFDEDGNVTVQEVPNPMGGSAVWQVNAGESGVLVESSERLTREGVYNAVVVTGEPLENHDPAYALVVDSGTASPTYWGTAVGFPSAYGQIPDYYTSELIRNDNQAAKAGTAQLRDRLGQAKQVSFSAVPNPALQPGDVIEIVYEDDTSELHLLDSITIPLTAAGVITAVTRSQPA